MHSYHYRSLISFAYALVVASFFVFETLYAAGLGTIKGRVLDKTTSDPLIGANLVVVNTSLGGSANLDGTVIVRGVPAGLQTLKISYVGYQPLTVQVNVVEDSVLEQEFHLSAQPIKGQEVVVTAQARGQNEAINQQLASSTLINVVSSEKMKELPDANIAESIGRLPGVSLQRNAGEADAVVVRGLSPKYNNITIEGVPMVSTSYGDRGIDLSLLSDDLVRGVELSKTLRPDMDADALGGTVNLTLKTAQEGFHYDVRGNGGYTKLDDSYNNYKVAGTVGDRFLDNNSVGLLLQGNVEEKQLPADQFNGSYAAPQGLVLANGDSIYNLSTQSANLQEIKTTRKRYGASAILDYSSDFVDMKFYSVYDQKRDSTITRSNQTTFLSGQFLDQIFASDTKTEQRTHSLQFLFKPWKTELPISISYTRGDVRTPLAQQLDIYGYEPANFTPVKLPATNFVQPSVLMAYNGVQQPNNSELQHLYMQSNALTDISYDAKADWKIHFSMSEDFSGVLSVGGKYHGVDRTNTQYKAGPSIQYGGPAGTRVQLIDYLTAKYPGFYSDPSDQTGIQAFNFVDPNYKGGAILGYPIGPQYDVYKLLSINSYFYANQGPASADNSYRLDGVNSYNQNYTDKEHSDAGYLMGEFNIGTSLTVIPGARFQQENTDITSYHILVDPLSPTGIVGLPSPSESKRNNPYWYPSVNVKYKASEKVQLLAAVYRSVSLPSFIDIDPVLVFSPGPAPQIAGGNPLLKPSTATNFDLAATVSDNNIGLFTVDLFYKQISNLIYTMQNYQPFLTSPVIGGPSDIRDRVPAAAYYDTNFAKQVTGKLSNIYTNIPMNNPEAAYLRGVEFSWQTHLWYLPGVLSGIVLDLNASFMGSNQLYPYFTSVKTGGSAISPVFSLVYQTRSGQLQDQPKATYNAILGWDYEGFSSRVSFRYQQVTLTGLDTRYSVRDAYYDNVLLIDISARQKLIGELAVFADVTNVNSHIDNYYLNYYNGNNGTSGHLPTSEQTYGLNAQLGISYLF